MTDDVYTSPIDGHAHSGVQARRECPVCTLELTAQSAMNVLRDFTERVATAAGVPLLWDEADQVGEPGTPKYNDRLIHDVEVALAERDRLLGIMTKMTNDGQMVVLTTDGYAELVAERDQLRAAVEQQGAVMGAVTRERDRLREVADEQGTAVALLALQVRNTFADNDRLQAVVDAANAYRHLMQREPVTAGWLRQTNEAAEAMFSQLEALDAGRGGEAADD